MARTFKQKDGLDGVIYALGDCFEEGYIKKAYLLKSFLTT